jgi:prepilin-type N-terminal cleavage/methylation domain-containing protein
MVMVSRKGITLMEIIVVLVIIGVAAAFFLPDFTIPMEKARASSVQNNLLDIYSAEQNYRNSNGSYCFGGAPFCDSLADINTKLSLNIQDDGAYHYFCVSAAVGIECFAERMSTFKSIILTLSTPVNLSATGVANPKCNLTPSWCP